MAKLLGLHGKIELIFCFFRYTTISLTNQFYDPTNRKGAPNHLTIIAI